MDVEYNQERYEVQDDSYTYKYRIYSNNQVTPQYIHVYSAGAGGILSDMSFMYNSTDKNDTLYFVLPSYTATDKAISAGEVYAKYIEELAKKYNIPASNISVAGYSQGANAASSTYASLVNNGYNIPFYVSHAGNSSEITRRNYERVAETYKKNGLKAPAFIYLSEGNAALDNPDYPTRANNLKWALEKWPGDVIELYNPNNMHKEQRPYSELDLVDFLNGTKELEGYDIFKYVKVSSFDANGNRVERTFATQEEFEQYILEYRKTFGISTVTESYTPIKFNIDEYEKIQSDDTVLQEYVDGIRNNLKIEASVHSYNSTTMVPSEESEAVHKFLEGTQSLFGIIESDTAYLLKMGLALKEMDTNLAAKGMEIDDVPSKEGGSSGWDIAGNFVKNIWAGVLFGTMTGSIIPGVGTAAGAVVGAIAGVVTSLIQLFTSNSSNETANSSPVGVET